MPRLTLPPPVPPVAFGGNPDLETFAPPGYRGVPVDARGRFINLEHPFYPYFQDLWKWQTSANPHKAAKKRDTWRLPVVKDDSFLHHRRNTLVWLGHAAYFLRLNGVNILIDPVLGDLNRFIRRRAELPVPISSLTNLDYILVSHDHRDHCDAPSLRHLADLNPRAAVLTGLNMTPLLRGWMPGNPIQEAGWYQRYNLPDNGLEIWYLPVRHWARRGLTDINRRLWGAFLFRWNGKTLYWGGDTGWGGHFDAVRALFGAPDIYLAGVGAYQPEWFMHSSHLSPADAARSGELLDASVFVPMHYGTFDLSDEPLGDPPAVLRRLQEEGHAFLKNRLHVPAVGEGVF